MSEHLGDVLHAYVDDELGTERTLDVRAHLAACAQCRRSYENVRALRGVLQRTLRPAEPSPAFLRRLRASLRRADPSRFRRRAERVGWAAVPLAAAALLTVAVFPGLRGPRPDLTGEVVAAHLRSLQVDHLTDVASSDRHTVKPWFQGKVPFSPPVPDLRDQGYPLEGGRLDLVGDRPVAALVYRARQHAINVLVWPDPEARDSAPQAETRGGIHVLHWSSQGMTWWAVSDVNAEELQRLAALLREAAP
ncbi:MAG TPA: anti-sigma factor [Myxococcaceae bacterium]|nr:anti-sigma factor [Myxococcaceae bacterium]